MPLHKALEIERLGVLDLGVQLGGLLELTQPLDKAILHRGRKNHMDRSMLCRRGLVNLISQECPWILEKKELRLWGRGRGEEWVYCGAPARLPGGGDIYLT